jgi:CheY-like chemotaxis protein
MDAHRRIAKPVVLIVEDEPVIRWSSADMLSDAGFEVIEARNADEALSVLRSRDDVRVLFTDVDMPGSIDGLELARVAHALWPKLRILVTSGKNAPALRALPENGSFVGKPYVQEQIVRDIGRLLAA